MTVTPNAAFTAFTSSSGTLPNATRRSGVSARLSAVRGAENGRTGAISSAAFASVVRTTGATARAVRSNVRAALAGVSSADQSADAVVTDYAPTAVVAARMLGLPAIAVGPGFWIPPADAPLPKYRYPSAGNLYPVQVYLVIKPGRVAGLDGGAYYYHPARHELARLDDAAPLGQALARGANPDGWYYDNAANPTKILFCPTTCSGPGADTAGKLDIVVGCKAPLPK